MSRAVERRVGSYEEGGRVRRKGGREGGRESDELEKTRKDVVQKGW